jgi:hypothetical protein
MSALQMIVTSTLPKLRHAEGLSKEVLSNGDTFSGESIIFPIGPWDTGGLSAAMKNGIVRPPRSNKPFSQNSFEHICVDLRITPITSANSPGPLSNDPTRNLHARIHLPSINSYY